MSHVDTYSRPVISYSDAHTIIIDIKVMLMVAIFLLVAIYTVEPLYNGHPWGTTVWLLCRGGCSSGVWLLWKSMYS